MRLLILCLLIYLGFRAVKMFRSPGKPSARPVMSADRMPVAVDDIMVRDPACGIYIPRKDAIRETIGGETCYFCSVACRDKYLEKAGKSSGQA
jgi:uncharacterized protein